MNSLQDLYCTAEQNGIPIDNFELEKAESVSLMDVSDQSCYIAIDYKKIRNSSDENTKLAHELGHCITGSFYNDMPQTISGKSMKTLPIAGRSNMLFH